jgi:SagB-type dehydrogenase family enzyme
MKHPFTYLFLIVFLLSAVTAQETPRRLPPPDTTGGKPLMKALHERKTSRVFGDETLSDSTLANILWAACGINRPDGHRTAPSAMNWQEIDVYAVMKDGVFLYDPAANALSMVSSKDVRAKTGMQDFVAAAPLNLVYVADSAKTKRATGTDLFLYLGADCGAIMENVYLYCASAGLACVVRGSVDRTGLAPELKLRPGQRIVLAQTIGWPK